MPKSKVRKSQKERKKKRLRKKDQEKAIFLKNRTAQIEEIKRIIKESKEKEANEKLNVNSEEEDQGGEVGVDLDPG